MSPLRPAIAASCLAVFAWITPAGAADTLSFSTQTLGSVKTVAQWGFDNTWASAGNARSVIVHGGGPANVSLVRMEYQRQERLNDDGSLGPIAIASLDEQAAIALMAGSPSLFW